MNPPETAPRDGTVFLAHIEGCPWMVPCVWNDALKMWNYANLAQYPISKGVERYFENECRLADALLGWLPMPEIENE